MQIIWIASYPRSGNTWMRLLLHEILFGPVESIAEMNRRIPDIHRTSFIDESRKGTIFSKTHFGLSLRHPYIGATLGCIYLIRNPRDVAISAMHYASLFKPHPDGEAGFIRDFIRLGGEENWTRQGFGTWAQHADSWVHCRPRLIVRYEDLRADPAAEMTRVLSFLGRQPDRAVIERAVERTELANLQRIEEREKREGRCWLPGSAEQLDKGERFFREGRTGQRLDEIEPGLDAMFDAQFGEAMARHGYAAGVCATPPA